MLHNNAHNLIGLHLLFNEENGQHKSILTSRIDSCNVFFFIISNCLILMINFYKWYLRFKGPEIFLINHSHLGRFCGADYKG